MSEQPPAPGWWQASDDRWYPPETHPDYVPPAAAPASVAAPEAPRRPPAGGHRRVAVIVAALLVLAGVGAFVLTRGDDSGGGLGGIVGGKSQPTLTNPSDVAAALNAGGYECTSYAPEPVEDQDDSIDLGVPDRRTGTGTCSHLGVELEIGTWSNERDRDAWINVGDTLGCSFLTAFGVSDFTLSFGPWWTVGPNDVDTQDSIDMAAVNQALGGKLHHTECDIPKP